MLLLAASLSDLHFQPGMPIPEAETSQITNDPGNESEIPVVGFRLLLQLPLVLIFTLRLIVLIIGLVKKIEFKKILKLAGGLLVVLCVFLLLNQTKFSSPTSLFKDSQGIGIPPSFNYDIAPIGNPPKKMFSFVTVILLLGASIFLIWLLYQTSHRSQKDDALAFEASTALKAIEDGHDLGNVIIRCYMQMARIVREEHRIERADSVTPREFEELLAVKGIPILPVHQLTRLFEKVRYGSKTLDFRDEQAAVECLSAIQISCETREQEN